MHRIFLSIGSNIEPERYFQQCAATLAEKLINPVWSPIYCSAAVGMEGDDFLNAVVMAYTDQPVVSTLDLLRSIEHDHGRKRSTDRFISRTLDVDLLLYDNIVADTPSITLPRTEIPTTAYVLKPLADLAPDDVHPVLEKTYTALLKDLEQKKPESIASLCLVNLNLDC